MVKTWRLPTMQCVMLAAADVAWSLKPAAGAEVTGSFVTRVLTAAELTSSSDVFEFVFFFIRIQLQLCFCFIVG